MPGRFRKRKKKTSESKTEDGSKPSASSATSNTGPHGGVKRLSGLKNSGNSCYMNAALQFLLAAEPFLSTFTSRAVLPRANTSNFHKTLVSLVKKMSGEGKSIEATEFRKIAAKGRPDFHSSRQQDSLEYFLHLLVKIEENLPECMRDKNPCDRMKIHLCEEICRSNETIYVHRVEYVLSCPLAGPQDPNHNENDGDPSNKQTFQETASLGDELNNSNESSPAQSMACETKMDAITGGLTSDDSDESTEKETKHSGDHLEVTSKTSKSGVTQLHSDGVSTPVNSPAQPTITSGTIGSTKKINPKQSQPPSVTGDKKRKHLEKQRFDLSSCIDKFMAEEQVLSPGTYSVTKQSRIATLPEYLVIQPRIFQINSSGIPTKLDVKIDVPDDLDFAKWICDDRWIEKCNNFDGADRKKIETKYRLKAFVTHRGSSPSFGHYVCYVNYMNDGGWYEYNDAVVTPTTNPPKESGYFYLYERIDRLCTRL